MKKRLWILAPIFLAAVSFVILYFINSPSAEKYKSEIEVYARESFNVSASWEAVSETSETIASVIFYDKDSSDHIFAIYLKDDDSTPRFSLIAGGALPVNQYQVAEISSDSFDEHIYVSLNAQKVCLLEISKDDGFSTIQIDPESPFLIILTSKEEEIAFYNNENSIVEMISFQF